MKYPSRKRTLRKVGLTSAIAVTVFASGIGVASASTHPTRPVSPPAAHGSKDAGATPPAPMPPRGPLGIGGDVTALTSSSITIATSSSSVTFSLTAATTVTDLRPGAKSEGLLLGENVRVVPSSSDSSVAASITIVPATIGIGTPPPGALGPPRDVHGYGPLAGPFAGGPPDLPAPSRVSVRGAVRR
jgi:hypothetical protein